jgi:biopolymer transport protein ExbD
VLLVLLVIFMVTQPLLRKAIDVQVPIEEEQAVEQQQVTQIVLEILADGSYQINTQPVSHADLPARLREIFAPRPDKLIFIKANNNRRYQEVIEMMDIARGAGVLVIGLAPEHEAGAGTSGASP